MTPLEISNLEQQAKLAHCRWLVHLAIPACERLTTIEGLQAANTLLVGPQGKNPLKPEQLLGAEYDRIIFDASHGLYPDALCAAAGSLRAGGLFFLITPPAAEWPYHPDVFSSQRCPAGYTNQGSPHTIQRLLNAISQQTWPAPCNTENPPEAVMNAGQQSIFMHWQNQLKQIHSCQVLSADRGRGKSYLLARWAEYLNQQKIRFAITGPNKHALAQLTAALGEYGQYVAPEQVSRLSQEIHLIVDEGASLPVPLLQSWAQHFNHSIFSSTRHGYEGTGKGFEIRFMGFLKQHLPHWQHQQLDLPVRYCAADPLEKLFYQSFMLDAELSPLPAPLNSAAIICQKLNPANDATQLQALFALLINAHYQSKPSDLRDILDSPNLHSFVLAQNGQMLAACLAAEEGPLPAALHHAIMQGERRPNGHLIPQSLAFYNGFDFALSARCLRIVRIATRPELQQQGLASQLLNGVENWAKQQGYAFSGSSFAATQDVLTFWQKNAYQVCRMGEQTDHISASVSALVLKGLNKQAEQHCTQAADYWQWLQTQHAQPLAFNALPENAKQLLKDFSYAQGSYSGVKPLLAKLATPDNCTEQQTQLLLAASAREVDLSTLASQFNLSGKKAVVPALREICRLYFAADI
ncbi:MAG: tRNA(Met) cytidine acetyltransferase [Oceanospirillaceae bacterium]|nr:tRNA(Met) cytidine acetyltransferase [Oceanospirillaceae bacterium]MCP5334192.1 tRNA(Met) cytidine acetyltransferase [Oceanospirillaceae bacterium]